VQAPAPAILPTASVPPPARRSSCATATGGLALGAAPPPLPSSAPTAPRVPTTVGSAGRAGPLEARTLEGVASVEGSGPPPVVPRLSVPDLVSQFIEFLGTARTPTYIAALELKRVSCAILERTCPSAVSVRHANGRVSVYCDGRTPGPHTRGTSSLPVKRGHVDSRHGRSDPVSPKRPLALAREICPTDAYFESFRWRSTCDRPVTHQPQRRSREIPGTSKSPRRLPVKGQISRKPDLDH